MREQIYKLHESNPWNLRFFVFLISAFKVIFIDKIYEFFTICSFITIRVSFGLIMENGI